MTVWHSNRNVHTLNKILEAWAGWQLLVLVMLTHLIFSSGLLEVYQGWAWLKQGSTAVLLHLHMLKQR